MKINTFKPEIKLYGGMGNLHDYLQLQIFWNNYFGLVVRVWGIGFRLRTLLFNGMKDHEAI